MGLGTGAFARLRGLRFVCGPSLTINSFTESIQWVKFRFRCTGNTVVVVVVLFAFYPMDTKVFAEGGDDAGLDA